MPNAQAVNELATAITNIFNNALPPSTPETVEAMADIRDKNAVMAAGIASAINTFVKKSKVTMTLRWSDVRTLLVGKLRPRTMINGNDVLYVQQNPGALRQLSNGTEIIIHTTGGNTSLNISRENAIE